MAVFARRHTVCDSFSAEGHRSFPIRITKSVAWRSVMRCLFATLFLAALVVGCNKPTNPPAPPTTSPTNTGVNARDANAPPGREPVTGQDENPADLEITAKIRNDIINGKDFGVNARNIKIMTSKGFVRLRGPVDTVNER